MKLIYVGTALLISGFSYASDQCALTLQDDLKVSPSVVSMQRGEQELWRIDTKGQLWLAQQKSTASPETQQHLKAYQQGIRTQVTASAALMDDSLQLARSVLDHNVQAVTGMSLAENPELQQPVEQLEQQLNQLVQRQGDAIYVYGSQLRSADKNLAKEAEQKIQQAVARISGQMMLTLGQNALQSPGTAAEKMQSFRSKMQNFGSQLKADMQKNSKNLRQRGQQICQQLKSLDQLEHQIQQQLPAMAPYDLIDGQSEGYKPVI
ncbi:DUF2884 family protein [Rheinheimera mesophila]|uniref:DUF2884 family protein n=1 Tax=Rheinheimera mesophila TaxID=1547515 RepID=A0A3P3QG75_9GAMM|nr:DUF2884 family protein [Rheinheimera mesophila]KKL01289.1 hypothetical protein SD53_10870 [Rheinheimera mesophila]RRJ20192.1 DUF2884 family protein [Rheinheimera mesophila]